MNITLKKPSLEDKEGLVKICNAVDRTYLSDRMPDPYTVDSAVWFLNMISENDGKAGIWRLIYADNELIGVISVEKGVDVYQKDGEIGYYILTDYWSKGIVTQAVKDICKLAFETLDIIRITGNVCEPNIGSKRVLEKSGFIQEGIKRNAITKADNTYNLYIMGLLKEDLNYD